MRRFEYVKGSSSKFWEIEVQGKKVTTRWGRIGTVGQSKSATLGSPALATAATDKQIREKLAKRYTEAKGAAKRAKSAKSAKSAKTAKSAKPPGEDSDVAKKLLAGGLSEDRVASILTHLRTRIDLGAKKLGKPTVGESRLGGEPDLPAGTDWPQVICTKKELVIAPQHFRAGTLPEPDAKGRYHVPLAFIAQIDLADLAAHDADGLLPAKGMLWCFVRPEITLDEKRERPVLASHVLYAKTTPKLVRTQPPASLPEWNRYRAAKPVLSHGRPLPALAVDPIRDLAMIQSERDAYENVFIKQHEPGIHSVLGWARAAYYRGMPGEKEQALLAIASDSVSGFEFGDCQSIFFCIPTAALAKQDFAKTVCLLDE